MIKRFRQKGKWKKPHDIEIYKDSHHATLEDIYVGIYEEKQIYPELLVFMKFVLLITPSIANIKRSFSNLNFFARKTWNSLRQKLLIDLCQYH